VNNLLNETITSQIDNFEFISGKYPIFLLGTHAFSNNLSQERELHLSDYFVSPFLKQINRFAKNDFFILENKTSRSIIDMNRKSARLNDEINENDFLYRQMIRFICSHQKRVFNKLPLVFDIHSYPSNDSWGENDMMILIQTKKNALSNVSLVDFTMNFFKSHKWRISKTTKHNQDDIVEELSSKNYAIPLLIEFNEKIMTNPNRLSKMVNDFIVFLQSVNEFNLEMIQDKSDSIKKTNSIELFQDLSHLKSLGDSAIINDIEAINSMYKQLTDLGYGDLTQLNEDISSASKEGKDFNKIVQNTAFTLSNHLKTAIIPIELIILQVRILYSNINRMELKEWGLSFELDSFLDILRSSKVIIPTFKSDPSKKFELIYKSYPLEEKYVNFIILTDSDLIQQDDVIVFSRIFNLAPTISLDQIRQNIRKIGQQIS
jgi:hypothetical protein